MAKYTFTKLHIHHFLSFDDARIDLTQKGYCLISGVNKNPKDAARSNGSGKSTICNALAFALLGETISGLRNNLANIYFDDGCYVELEFFVDNTKYNLLRSKSDTTYGTNLKVFVNDEDKSGKGIKESQAILDELLPDITRDLIGSVILLGQGLPDRFTANTPSKRKELLEHLSKSDFMIQDLKERLEARTQTLNNNLHDQEIAETTANSKKSLLTTYLEQENKKLTALSQTTDYNSIISEKKKELSSLQETYDANEKALKELETEEKSLNESLLSETNEKNNHLNTTYKEHVDYSRDLNRDKWTAEQNIKYLEQEITRLKSIKDVCPTCGQKIPGAIKQDTSEQEHLLEEAKKSLSDINNMISEDEKNYNDTKVRIEENFNKKTSSIRESIKILANKKVSHNNSKITVEINTLTKDIITLEKDRDSHEKDLLECKNKIEQYNKELKDISTDLEKISTNKSNIDEHLAVVAKMNTFIKRDFRGILISNSISYINKKAKEYALKIFNTDEIEFKLAGNDIDILFCDKDYENLSGGEKQRIDLITQFAIRDMLAKQLNFSSNILFLDEITDNLDKESCDKVIDFITSEFKDIESIFIISHHLDLDIPYDSEITVYKDIMGVSRI